jgi:hypothetical protein
VTAAGLAAQLSVATVGALPWLALPIAAVAYVAACEVADRATGKRSQALRWAGTGLVLAGVLLLGPRLAITGDREQLKQTLGMMLITAQVGQALSWRQQRDVRSALMASFGLLVLSASYAPDVLIGVPLLLGWSAVIVALALLGGLGRLEATRAAAVAVVLGLVGFLVIPVTPTEGARSRLAALAAGSSASRLPTDAFNARHLDLRRRGTLGTADVLRVPQGSPPLWRAASFDDYDGTSWNRHVQGARLSGDGPVWKVSPEDAPTRTDDVQRLGDAVAAGTVWSPGRIVSVRADEGFGPIADDQGDVLISAFTPAYQVTSIAPPTDPALLRSRTGTDLTDPRWRALPTELPARVGELARQLQRATRYDTAETIAGYLRAHATYRLDSPVPLPGQDAVDRFLFVDRSGFCEQFASAEVVLLRSLGIPSRLVTGLGYGVQDGDHVTFRVSDLHAWAELWVPGVGWVSSDPTPGSPQAAGAGIRRRLANAMSSALRWLTRIPGGRPALAALLLILGLLASVLLTRAPRRRAAAAAVRAGPALAAFFRLDERLGPARRREQESLRELARRLDPELRQALAVVERECYAPGPPEPTEVRAAVAVLDRASGPEPAGPRARQGRRGARGRTPRRG